MTTQTETQIDLLTKRDAERLEKAGFSQSEDGGGNRYVQSPPVKDVIHEWAVDWYRIDPALLGVLEDMVWRKGWEIQKRTTRHYFLTGGIDIGPWAKYVVIYANATPRKIFEAFMNVLEAE